MARLLRWTIAWLLAIALPVQGVSATTLPTCSGGVHAQAVDAVHPGAHRHHHGGGSSKPAKTGGHPCGACASCCVGAAMPSTLVPFGPMPIRRGLPPFLAPSPTAFVGDGLDRPPKRLPA